MKSIKSILAIVVIAITATSCVESSEKYKSLVSERDQLLQVEQNYKQTLDVLNEIEGGFASIREVESKITVQLDGIEGQSQKKKKQLASQITQIKEILAQNKSKIDGLQSQLSKSGKKNSALSETIKRLEEELTGKLSTIESLQAELSAKNIKIEEMTGTIDVLNKDVEGLNEVSASQQATISTQDADLNRVWYIVADSKLLKEHQILKSNGIFRAKTLMNKDFNKDAFTQIDLRELKTIPTGAKKPKVLSSHTEGSYKLNVGADKMVTLEIIDPAKFWSVSKYLVIQK